MRANADEIGRVLKLMRQRIALRRARGDSEESIQAWWDGYQRGVPETDKARHPLALVPVLRRCQRCKAYLLAQPARLRRGEDKYCSVECLRKKLTRRETLTCKACGREFEGKKSKRRKYCSMRCYGHVRNRVTIQCANCGADVTDHLCRNRKFCSRRCYGLSMRGKAA